MSECSARLKESETVGEQAAASGPDLSEGIALAELPSEGTLAARVGGEAILLSQIDGEWFAVSGTCTHYGGNLAEGLIGRCEVRCPLHHACFDLKTGAVLRAPALDPLSCWKVEIEGDRLFVREELEPPQRETSSDVQKVVIIGGGAAGLACANELRKLGYQGAITMLSADSDPPCDRPNLSKDYLAGTAPEEWIPLRGDDWYREQRVDLRLNATARAIDTNRREVELESGERLGFDRLLLATGSEPRRLKIEGSDGEHVLTLRSLADARAIIEHAKPGTQAVIIGSSFIGLEAAAALRNRDVEVTVVSPEQMPFERVLGPELGRFVQQLHQDHGVRFRLGTVPARFDRGCVTLATGEELPADFVLVGIGVTPRTQLAEAAGLDVDNGVWVDEHLETRSPGIFAAGDIAAYPHPRTSERVRIEHWTVAERQGEVAAANMLGQEQKFDSAPFFWTEQYGVPVRYVGHGVGWDEVRVDGTLGDEGGVLRYYRNGSHIASASINRDREILEDELRLEAQG
jgi:NADPH-dependent 2,4-dienoyl-CoA reductase/sulfur reductase-like enzyme/nitrite reductase/ring-hydroxylating ferredoxin subunit